LCQLYAEPYRRVSSANLKPSVNLRPASSTNQIRSRITVTTGNYYFAGNLINAGTTKP
jgi:hypothetical protein